MDQNDQPTSQNQKYPEDMQTLDDIGSDDIVVCTNIFDEDLVFDYASQPHRWKAGQTTTLLGYKARLFLKKLAHYGHLHKEQDVKDTGTNIRDNYPLTDKFLSQSVVNITRGMQPEQANTTEEVAMPEYISQDEHLAKNAGGGATELAPVKIDPTDVATDESEAKYDAPQYNRTPQDIDEEKNAEDLPDSEGDEQNTTQEQPFPTVTQRTNPS